MIHRLIIDMTFETEDALEDVLGTHFVREGAGQVDVAATGTQVGEVVTVSVEGEITDILEFLIKEWEDDGLAAQAFAEAVVNGALEEM